MGELGVGRHPERLVQQVVGLEGHAVVLGQLLEQREADQVLEDIPAADLAGQRLERRALGQRLARRPLRGSEVLGGEPLDVGRGDRVPVHRGGGGRRPAPAAARAGQRQRHGQQRNQWAVEAAWVSST